MLQPGHSKILYQIQSCITARLYNSMHESRQLLSCTRGNSRLPCLNTAGRHALEARRHAASTHVNRLLICVGLRDGGARRIGVSAGVRHGLSVAHDGAGGGRHGCIVVGETAGRQRLILAEQLPCVHKSESGLCLWRRSRSLALLISSCNSRTGAGFRILLRSRGWGLR